MWKSVLYMFCALCHILNAHNRKLIRITIRIVVYVTTLCVNWAFSGISGPV
jgi:hypothetical protein